MTFTPLSIPNNEAQFLETRKFQVTEICRIFRVPPHMIGDLERATFSNIESQNISFAVHTIRPWLVRIEQAVNRALIPENEKGRFYAQFNIDGLMRGDYKRLRVAAYARVSTEKGAMLHSLAAQISYYSELIQSNPEYKYAGVYADEGLSGTLEGRPEFQRMLRDCRAGKIDRILCKSISRFARNTLMLLNTVRELKQLGVSVYFEEQNIDTMSGEGELMLTVLASFAQEESRSVSENCKWRIRKKFEQGIPTGLCMYGYKVKNGVFTIIPEEAEIIRRIFRMYLEGMGCERIMKALTKAGIPAPNGGLWSASTILLMLRNEKYAGDLLLQKYYINNHIEKKQLPNCGELPQYAVTEDHEPIIDRATFDAVQKEIRWRAAMVAPAMNGDNAGEECDSRKSDKQAAPAMAIPMICGICGKRYRRKITRRGTAYAAPVWICSTYNYRGKAYCASKQIPEPILLELIATALGTRHTLIGESQERARPSARASTG